MDEASDPRPPDNPGRPEKKKVNAKEFVAAFMERPDDFHLMSKFEITPKHLKQIYSALIERGLLSEYEYNQRERKVPELEEHQRPVLSASASVRLVEEPSEDLTELVKGSGYTFDTGLGKAVSQALDEKRRKLGPHKEPEIYEKKVSELCPNCHKPKDPSSPGECVYCGVVFKKVEGRHGNRGIVYDD